MQRTITLTDRPPVVVDEVLWPEVARADGLVGRQEYTLRVRRHADGRQLVYGVCTVRGKRAGRFLEVPVSGAVLVETIREVATLLSAPDLAETCIAALPPEKL